MRLGQRGVKGLGSRTINEIVRIVLQWSLLVFMTIPAGMRTKLLRYTRNNDDVSVVKKALSQSACAGLTTKALTSHN